MIFRLGYMNVPKYLAPFQKIKSHLHMVSKQDLNVLGQFIFYFLCSYLRYLIVIFARFTIGLCISGVHRDRLIFRNDLNRTQFYYNYSERWTYCASQTMPKNTEKLALWFNRNEVIWLRWEESSEWVRTTSCRTRAGNRSGFIIGKSVRNIPILRRKCFRIIYIFFRWNSGK